jgi:hypothetical protein
MYVRTGMGTNGDNVNVDAAAPARVAVSPHLLRTLTLLRPAKSSVPVVSTGFPGWGGGDGSGITLGPGESVPPEENGLPAAEPLVDLPAAERPVWLLPVLALGGLAVVGGGIWFFAFRGKD